MKPFLIIIFLLINTDNYAQIGHVSSEIDVYHYDVEISPDLSDGTIEGIVNISLKTDEKTNYIALDCGKLLVDEVTANGIVNYFQEGKKLFVKFSKSSPPSVLLSIKYHGKLGKGTQLFKEVRQLHTVYFTSGWMVCNDHVSDKATFQIKIISPQDLVVIGTGNKTLEVELENHFKSTTWVMNQPISSYIFGFAIGDFIIHKDSINQVQLVNYAHNYHKIELETIFKETSNMLSFFEDKSGVLFPFKSYNQVLGKGNISQEMAGFTVMRNSYGKQVLGDSTQINLSAHELAHQWWGNLVTCKSFRHFWLNEAFAVYMSTAFKEYRFGKKYYDEDIKVYYDAWQKVVEKGMDKPLVFQNWHAPTADDRTIVYYKGAYFLHILREEIGEKSFWRAMMNYTQKNSGKSVVSKDFQKEVELVVGKNLKELFNEWVY